VVSRIHDVSCAVDHVIKFLRPSPSIFAYVLQAIKTRGVEGLATILKLERVRESEEKRRRGKKDI